MLANRYRVPVLVSSAGARIAFFRCLSMVLFSWGGAFLIIMMNGIAVFSLSGAFLGAVCWVYTIKLKKSLCGRFNGFFMKITFSEKIKSFYEKSVDNIKKVLYNRCESLGWLYANPC